MYDLYDPPPTRRSDHTTIALATIALILIAALVIFGTVRYGGLEGLVLRVRTEIAAHRPHPELVPTAMPYDASSAERLATPSPTATLFPAPTPTPDAGSAASLAETNPTRAAVHQPAAPSVELTGLSHVWQTWNNCGPATLAMSLSYYGCDLEQEEVGEALRTNREDKNVSPDELVAFARSQGLEALTRVNGDADLLRTLLSNNMPVLIETWVEPEPGDGLGHYRLLTGYDDAAGEWIAYDSFVSAGVDPDQPYRGIRLPYDESARDWAVFNRVYVLIYSAQMEPLVQSILGPDLDEEAMWQSALQDAGQAVQQQPDDPFAWFNLGTDLVALGQFERAAAAYDRARTIGLPWRMLWYQFGPFAAYHSAGRYDELVTLTDATLALTTYVEEVHYWRGLGLRDSGDLRGASQAFRRALALNPDYTEAADALATLERPTP